MSDNYEDFNYDQSMYTGYNQGVQPVTPEQPVNAGMTGGSRNNKPEKKSGFGKSMAKVTALALTFGLVSGAAFQGVNYMTGRFVGTKQEAEADEPDTSASDNVAIQPAVNTSGTTGTVSYDVAEIVDKAQTSIVSITTKVGTPI